MEDKLFMTRLLPLALFLLAALAFVMAFIAIRRTRAAQNPPLALSSQNADADVDEGNEDNPRMITGSQLALIVLGGGATSVGVVALLMNYLNG